LFHDIRPIVYGIFKRIGIVDIDIVNIIIVTIAVFGCLVVFLKKIQIGDVVILLLIATYHQVSAILFPLTAVYSQDNATHFIWACLPMYIVGLTVDKKTSPVIFVGMGYFLLVLKIIGFVLFAPVASARDSETLDFMVTAYQFLPLSLFMLWYAFERGGFFNYLMALISVFYILSLGTRGPVMCLVSFVVLYLVFLKDFKHNKIVKFFLILGGFVCYQFSMQIALFLSVISTYLGLSTRVYNSILEQTMTNLETSSGRDTFYQTAIDYMRNTNNNIFFGEGLYSDRYIAGHEQYVHNLELELLCDFGWIGGTVVFLFLIAFITRAFHKARATQAFSILFVFFCSAIIEAQFSGSFLTSSNIWFFLGICMAMQRKTE
jgi:hypothetical protein